jgi:hypothetical protein
VDAWAVSPNAGWMRDGSGMKFRYGTQSPIAGHYNLLHPHCSPIPAHRMAQSAAECGKQTQISINEPQSVPYTHKHPQSASKCLKVPQSAAKWDAGHRFPTIRPESASIIHKAQKPPDRPRKRKESG